jgi:hypothetical protein
VRKVAIVGSASGNGKTTLGKRVARRLDVPFVELDALVHGPNWAETPDDELRARVQPVIDSADWVIDGAYRRKLGDLVLEHADTVVWLDLPVRVWFPRLLRRTVRRLRTRESSGTTTPSRDAAPSGGANRCSALPSGCTSSTGGAIRSSSHRTRSSASARRARSSAGCPRSPSNRLLQAHGQPERKAQ